MFGGRDEMRRAGTVALVIGTTVGAAAAVVFGVRARRQRASADRELPPELLTLEDAVVNALANDEMVGSSPLEVEAIARGIVELSGSVDTEGYADRAVLVAQAVPGVRTVLNRIDLAPEVRHLADTRRRFDEGEPALRETRWYGVGVGTGRRRQSAETDPPRRDDRLDMITGEFEADAVVMEEEPGGMDRTPPRDF